MSGVLLGGLARAEETLGKPEFHADGSITCGAKSVQLRHDGVVSVVLGNDKAMRIEQQMDAGAAGWLNPSRLLRKSLKVDVRKRTALFRAKIPLSTDATGPRAGYRLAAQLMDDGLVSVKSAYFLPKGQSRLPDDNMIFQVPFGLVAGRTILVDGQPVRFSQSDAPLTEKHKYLFPIHRRDPKTVELFADEPDRHLKIGILNARSFIIREQRTKDAYGEQCAVLGMNSVGDELDARLIEFTLDIRRATPEALARSPDCIEGIDFYKSDRLHVPRYGLCRNLVQNPSFEAGLRYWHYSSTGIYPEKVKEPYVLDRKVAHSGRSSARFHVTETRPPGIATFAIPTETGRPYTFSFYAKGQRAGSRIHVGLTTAVWEVFPPTKSFTVGSRWRRYSHTFTAPNNGVKVHLSAAGRLDPREDYAVLWVDDVQLEKLAAEPEEEVQIPEGPGEIPVEALEDDADELDDGETEDPEERLDLTEYTQKPVILDLVTNQRDHVFQPGEAIDARLVVMAEQRAKGKLSVTVGDFEYTIVWKGAFDVACNKTGVAEIGLPFDGRLPRGIFYISAEIAMADGFVDRDFFRITVMDFLENRHKHRRLCGTLPWLLHPDQERYLRRFRQIGIGSLYDYAPQDKAWYDALAAQGIEPAYTCLFPRNRAKGIGITSLVHALVTPQKAEAEPQGEEAKSPAGGDPARNDDLALEKVLPLAEEHPVEDTPAEEVPEPREETPSEKGSLPDFEETIREHCREMVTQHPYLKRWKLLDEPWGWVRHYGTGALVSVAEVAYKAVKEADPEALVMTPTPCGMEPRKGIKNLSRYLRAGGIKYTDIVGTNCYRSQPENPDLDADLQTFLAMLKGYGYEGEFSLCGIYHQNYSLPAYGLDAYTGCSSDHCRLGSFSYHGGWGERMSAAYTARSWLVGFKYASRLRTFIDWSYDYRYLLDVDMIPYAVSIVPNTLGMLLGNADFVEDISFDEPIRCYVFRDDKDRPVVALWPIIEAVDRGKRPPPVMHLSGADASIEVLNLMGVPRDARAEDGLRVVLTPYPTFLRGAPGSLARMRKLLKDAEITGAEEAARLVEISTTDDGKRVKVTYHNRSPRRVVGQAEAMLGTQKVLGEDLELPSRGRHEYGFSIADRVEAEAFADIPVKATFAAQGGEVAQHRAVLRVLGVRHAPKPITADGDLSDWDALPAIDFPTVFWESGLPVWLRSKYPEPIAWRGPRDLSAQMRVAWDEGHLYLAFAVADDKLSCLAGPGASGYGMDCVELGFDTKCDARASQVVSIDGNDYIYCIYPYQDGSCAAYRDYTPYTARSFLAKSGVEKGVRAAYKRDRETQKTIYEIAFPKRYLHPIPLQSGAVFGFVAFIPDHDGDYEKRGVTMTVMPKIPPRGRPQLWPVLALMD